MLSNNAQNIFDKQLLVDWTDHVAVADLAGGKAVSYPVLLVT